MDITDIHLRQCFYDKDKQPSSFVCLFCLLFVEFSDIIINNTNNNLYKQIQYCQSYS